MNEGKGRNKDEVMSAKRWFIMLGCAAALVVGCIVALNIAIDPFSVFGDRLYSWHSYGMTNNPKAAKYSYIDERRGEYDAFIIGPSGASGISPDMLEKYTGLRWYNMFNYGADLDYTKKLAEYLIKKHDPKQMLLCLPAVSAEDYASPVTDITFRQPLKALWKIPFAFANPKYAVQKTKDYDAKSYIQQPFDVFTAETGVYDKSRRDAEAIGAIDEYLANYPEFSETSLPGVYLDYIDECAGAVSDIVQLCRENGTQLFIVITPIFYRNLERYDAGQIRVFYERIAEISGFWDFSVSSVSYDPRYFYDATHFRNSIGDIIVARMFDDHEVYIPEGFGLWVTRDNAPAASMGYFPADVVPVADPSHTKDLPVLLYHHIGDAESGAAVVSPDRFEAQIKELSVAGYTAMSLAEICDFVKNGNKLPENPIIITFDDGYTSNYINAFPVLRRHGFKATVFAIGVSFGKDTYKDTGEPIIPHFGASEALEMVRSGLISVQSHTFDMHMTERFDYPLRNGVLRMENETEEDYIAAFRDDYKRMETLIKESTGEALIAFAYPFGEYDALSSILLRDLGVTVTFTTKPGMNTLIKGLPQSILGLRRYIVTDDMTGKDIIEMLGNR